MNNKKDATERQTHSHHIVLFQLCLSSFPPEPFIPLLPDALFNDTSISLMKTFDALFILQCFGHVYFVYTQLSQHRWPPAHLQYMIASYLVIYLCNKQNKTPSPPGKIQNGGRMYSLYFWLQNLSFRHYFYKQ